PTALLYPPLPSFPTRRSSDLKSLRMEISALAMHTRSRYRMNVSDPRNINTRYRARVGREDVSIGAPCSSARLAMYDKSRNRRTEDRKSTRLNSSHQIISYAVF